MANKFVKDFEPILMNEFRLEIKKTKQFREMILHSGLRLDKTR